MSRSHEFGRHLGKAPSGAACQGSTVRRADMPLLTELERGLVGPRSYKHAAPSGAVTHVPRREIPGLTVLVWPTRASPKTCSRTANSPLEGRFGGGPSPGAPGIPTGFGAWRDSAAFGELREQPCVSTVAFTRRRHFAGQVGRGPASLPRNFQPLSRSSGATTRQRPRAAPKPPRSRQDLAADTLGPVWPHGKAMSEMQILDIALVVQL
jgi:hypothetical protein